MKTLIFPNNFISNQDDITFYVRLLPNLTNLGMGDNIIESTPNIRKTAFGDKPQHRYYSYALIKEWKDINKYAKDEVCVFRYGKSVYDSINKFLSEGKTNLFDLRSAYSLYLKVKHKYVADGGTGRYYHDYEIYLNQSYDNVIYDESHPGKSDKEKVKRFLMDRDLNIERLAINESIEPYKSNLQKKYIQLLREEKLNEVIN